MKTTRIRTKTVTVLGLLLAGASLTQGTTVFNDTFTNGSTLNGTSNPTGGNATSYDVASSKGSTNSIASNNLKLSFTAATTSGFMETQARFTNYPVALNNVGEQITLTATVKTTTNIISGVAGTGSYLCTGLYNSGTPSVAPRTNLASSGLSSALGSANTTGGVLGWQGYVSRIAPNTFNSSIYTRPAQSGADTSSQNQDLIGNDWGGGAYDTPTGVTLGTLASTSTINNGSTYTIEYRIELTATNTLGITSRLYDGTGTGGTLLFDQTSTAATTNFLTSAFDGLAIGFRFSGSSAIPQLDIKSFKIETNAPSTIVPLIETAPLAQNKVIADNVDLSVVANGGGAPGAGLSYQWFKDDIAITLGENATAQSATLNFPSAAIDDSGAYKVTVTNVAGSVTTTPVNLVVTASGGAPPSISTPPVSASILTGESNTFSVVATGTGTITYQWQFSNNGGASYSDIGGATGSSYEVTGATLSDTGRYQCVVTDTEGSVSASANLTVRAPGTITAALNDGFSSGSKINQNPTSPATPGSNALAYQQVSAKTFSPSPPSISGGVLKFGIVATSSGFNSIEALFTGHPLTLSDNGDYLEMTATFTSRGNINTTGNSALYFGLYNGNQIQPKPGGVNALSDTAIPGFAASWQGYVSKVSYSGGTDGIYTRPAKLDSDTSNQDVLYNYGGGSQVGSTATSTLAALTTNSQYTEVYRITRSSATELAISSTFYSGASATGTPLSSVDTTSSSVLTDTFDALAIGWRATASAISIMDVNSINITTNTATVVKPVIVTPPLNGQTKSVGESVDLTVVANGGGAVGGELTYQWFKDDVALTLGENPTAKSATLSFPSPILTDSGNYKVTVTNPAGSVTTTNVVLTISNGPIAPSILTQPVGATLLIGGSHTFSILANGTATLAYQWQFSDDDGANYTDIGGANASTYEITSAVPANGGKYRCVVTNGIAPDATSTEVTLVINQAPEITSQPVGATLNTGDPLSLSVTATGTPTPTYQWKRNGVNISGATASTYSAASVTGAHTGNYTVVVTNSVGSVTSDTVAVAVVSGTFAPTAYGPASAATDLNPDTRLSITFNSAVTPGVSGFLRIYDASDDSVVDTIDFAAATALRDSLRLTSTISTLNLPVQNKTIGGVTNFNYYAVTVSGNTATLYPRDGVLGYNKSYYVKIDAGSFVNSSGESMAAVTSPSTWTFSTKAAGPDSGATVLTVNANGSGDFNTVQGAIDWIPAANTTPRTLSIKNGTYFEQIVFSGKHFITFLGESRPLTRITYPNNNNFNNVSGFYHRATFIGSGVHDAVVTNLTFHNTTPQNGSQAESFVLNGSGSAQNIVTKCDFLSYQDTILIDKQTYISDCRIEGDTDFMWGGGPAYFENCDIKILRSGAYFTQVRNNSGNHGYVFNHCRFTAGAGFTGNYLGRIDPAAYPYSEVVVLNSTFGDATNNSFLNTSVGVSSSSYKAGWWLLNNNTDGTTNTATLHNWDNNTVDKDSTPLDFASRPAFTVMPTDLTTLANYADVEWVLNTTWAGDPNGTWNPALAPVFLIEPQGQSVSAGDPVTLTAEAAAVPAASYQWYLDDVLIDGATSATYQISGASAADDGSYTVVATNTAGDKTSAAAIVTVAAADPYSNYISGFGLDPETDGAADVDYEKDGLSNKLEFFLGGSPIVSDLGVLPVAHRESGPVFVYEFNRNPDASATPFVVEHGENVSDWTPAVNGVDGVTIVEAPANHFTVTVPASAATLFMRLRVP